MPLALSFHRSNLSLFLLRCVADGGSDPLQDIVAFIKDAGDGKGSAERALFFASAVERLAPLLVNPAAMQSAAEDDDGNMEVEYPVGYAEFLGSLIDFLDTAIIGQRVMKLALLVMLASIHENNIDALQEALEQAQPLIHLDEDLWHDHDNQVLYEQFLRLVAEFHVWMGCAAEMRLTAEEDDSDSCSEADSHYQNAYSVWKRLAEKFGRDIPEQIMELAS
jgi:hypothetical protein